MLRIDNYIIKEPIIDILNKLKYQYPRNKLQDIIVKSDEIIVTCPNSAHSGAQEKNPDCHINIAASTSLPYGTFHCFGCGESGSFIKFVSLYFDSSFDFAKQWLIDSFGIKDQKIINIDNEIIIGQKNKTCILVESQLDQYQQYCPYLQKRGISRELAMQFNVRYDPKQRQIIFPIYDIKGRLVMLAKRSIDTKVFYMTKDVEKEIYCLNKVIKNKYNYALLTEGPFDALSGWTVGLPTIATLGTISKYQIQKLNNSGLKVIYLAFDNDAAGKRFAKYIKANLSQGILTIDIELPKDKKDLNELSQNDWEQIKQRYNLKAI